MNRTARRRALRAACLTAAVLLSLPGCTQPGDRNSADTQPDTTEAIVTEEPFTIPEDDSRMDEGYFSIAYETQSYVPVGGEIGLAADFIRHDGRDTTCFFRSLDTSVVTVTPDGRVTGVAPGTARLRFTAAQTASMAASCPMTWAFSRSARPDSRANSLRPVSLR